MSGHRNDISKIKKNKQTHQNPTNTLIQIYKSQNPLIDNFVLGKKEDEKAVATKKAIARAKQKCQTYICKVEVSILRHINDLYSYTFKICAKIK